MSRFQATALVVVGLALLGYFFLADQIYLWVVTNEIGVMLHPASRGYCAYPALWMPFEGALALTPSSSHAPGFPPSTFLSPDHTSNIASHDGPSQGASRVTLVAVMGRRPRSEAGESATPAFKRLSDRLMALSLEQQQAYARFWGYDHLLWEGEEGDHAARLEGRPVAWGKLLALREALATHEYALYMDLDVALVQPLLSLEGFIARLESQGKDVLVAEDRHGVNTGVMLIRRSEWSLWFLEELWRVGASLVDCDCLFYYEQRAVHHALQTPQWREGYKWWTRHIPVVGWFRNSLRGHPPGPTLEELPLRWPNQSVVASDTELWRHVEVAPQCAWNAVDAYAEAEFVVHFAGQKGTRKEKLMEHYGRVAEARMEKVAKPLRARWERQGGKREGVKAGGEAAGEDRLRLLPLVHQTWKTHALGGAKQAWHMSWRRNGFEVRLRNDTECLEDIWRLCRATGDSEFMHAFEYLNPVQRADFWRYAVTWLDGGIYSDIDIGATPETALFFLEHGPVQGKEGAQAEGGGRQGMALAGIVENSPYDNVWGRMHWKVGMSPMYSRLPQLRQSFFYAQSGHPDLLLLMQGIKKMVLRWEGSAHMDLGRAYPKFTSAQLKDMEMTGALTLEMTGPGVWTDYMLAPLLRMKKESGGARMGRKGGQGKELNVEDERKAAELNKLRASSVILDTMAGYEIIRYGSMGSWKTDAHKADVRMWRNLLLFYLTPVLLALLMHSIRRRWRDEEKRRKARHDEMNGHEVVMGGGGGMIAASGGGPRKGGLLGMGDRDKVH